MLSSDFDELTLGKVLGKGGFGTVWEIRAFSAEEPINAIRRSSIIKPFGSKTFDVSEDKEVDAGQVESRKFIAKHCIRNGGDARYAVKILSPETTKDSGKHCQGESHAPMEHDPIIR